MWSFEDFGQQKKLLEANLINAFDSSIIFLLTFDCLGGIAKRDKKENLCESVSMYMNFYLRGCE